MNSEKFGGDAIFVKLGFLEIGAVGQLGVTAVVFLIVLYFGIRANFRKR